MPRGKSHGPSIEDDRRYEALRDQGMSREKAARIANESAASSRSTVGRRGGKAQSSEDQTTEQLRTRAAEIGIEGRSKMRKRELVHALRNH